MRGGAIVCFVVAAAASELAVRNVMQKMQQGMDESRLIGFAVGSFILPVVLLIVGLNLWNKSR
jgi:tetrahydromethanopterin S-methyltransferase subunit F